MAGLPAFFIPITIPTNKAEDFKQAKFFFGANFPTLFPIFNAAF
jgi:hypothetical protein